MNRISLRSAAVLAALVLIVAGCGNAKSGGGASTGTTAPTNGGAKNRNVHKTISGVPGVTDSTISYELVATEKSPLGICILKCYTNGVKAYFAYRNSQGGIYGRKLKISKVEGPALAQANEANDQIASGSDVFGTFQATLLGKGWNSLYDAHVPTYAWGVPADQAANRDSIFLSLPLGCVGCTRRILPYAAKMAGAHKAAALGYGFQDASKNCASAAKESFDKYAKQSGVKFAYLNNDLDYGLTNGVRPAVTAMKKAGVDFIMTCFDFNAVKTLAEELKRQGMLESTTIFCEQCYDEKAVSEAGSLFDGDMIEAQFRPFQAAAGNSSLGEFKKWVTKQGGSANELAMVGWLNASLAFDGLLAAGPQFDRNKVIQATNSFDHWTAEGLTPPQDWTHGHATFTQKTRLQGNPGPNCATLVVVKSGKFTIPDFESPEKPWVCWPGDDLSWSEPKQTNFH